MHVKNRFSKNEHSIFLNWKKAKA